MKTIGIIGGMGPLAAARLFERIILLTKASGDNEHIPMIIDNNTNIPDRTNHILNKGDSPLKELVRSALRLEMMGADAIIIACNTAHYYYEEIVKFTNIPVINMIEETAKYAGRRFPSAVSAGLLATEGTCSSGIYSRIFQRFGIGLLTPEPEEQKIITSLIYSVKANNRELDHEGVRNVVSNLRDRGAGFMILGCTELPIAFERFNICSDYVDSLEVLAMSAIAFAGTGTQYCCGIQKDDF